MPVLAIALLLAAGQPAAGAVPPTCAEAQRAAPAAAACVDNPGGVVLAVSAAEATRLAAAVRDGEERFVRHFGRPPARYAIAQGPAAQQLAALNAVGFRRTLPWLTIEEFQTSALQSIRRGVEARTAALTAEQRAAAVTTAEQQWLGRNSLEVRATREAGVVPHEIGHGWYTEAFWPGVPMDRGAHYGGPGPDWLDETAAVLMENDSLTADRRAQFERIYRGTPPASGTPDMGMGDIPVAELLDLPLFLSRDHPAKDVQNRPMPFLAPGEGIRIGVLTGDEARQVVRRAGVFYLQARMFADFLVDKTGDPAVFARIGEAYARGETTDAWLAREGRTRGLGGSVAELDVLWRAWLSGRFGPPREG